MSICWLVNTGWDRPGKYGTGRAHGDQGERARSMTAGG